MVFYLFLCPLYTIKTTTTPTINRECFYIYPEVNNSDVSWGGWNSQPNIIFMMQHFSLTLIVLHFGMYIKNDYMNLTILLFYIIYY